MGLYGDPETPDAPAPTPEERALQQLQLSQLTKSSEYMDLIAPYLLEEAGYRMKTTTTGAAGEPLSDVEQRELKLLKSASDYIAGEGKYYGAIGKGEGADAYREVLQKYPETQGIIGGDLQNPQGFIDYVQGRIAPLETKQQGYETGKEGVTLEKIPWEERYAGMDPQERKEYELYDAFLERQKLAIEGKLPPSPALERDIAESRGLLTEGLQRQVGPAYLRSTAGGNVMTRFEEGANITREAARQGLIGQGLGAGAYQGAQPVGIGGAAGVPGAYAGLTGPIGGALQPYQLQRGMQYEAGLTSAATRARSRAGLLGLLGTGIGYYLGGPAGGAAGGAAASNL